MDRSETKDVKDAGHSNTSTDVFGSRRRAMKLWGVLFCALLLAVSAMNAVPVSAAEVSPLTLMPAPRSIELGTGVLKVEAGFNASFPAFHDARLESGLGRMLSRLERTCGTKIQRTAVTDAGKASIVIDVSSAGDLVQSLDEDESYTLIADSRQVHLSAATVVGALRGMETLLQLARFDSGACVLPAVTIHDRPRFRWRGLMMDVSRHFEPVGVIKRNLDGMAMVKLNVFHWHLADDQGFRAESRRFPKLTGMGSNGEFYTQEQMREVVAYARERGIRVVPEFDMPGHTLSWQVGYPQIGSSPGPHSLPVAFGIHDEALDPTREETYKFIDTFIGEMVGIFPDAYFHIGGDETNGVAWLANPKITAFMQTKGLKDSAALQAHFNQRLLPIVKRHGRRMIGWDEILNPALPKDIVIQSWRGDASLAEGARQGFSGILSAPYYLDGMKPSDRMYLADPVPSDTALTPAQQKLILGGEICMWSEQLSEETIDSRIWPRSAAIAERFWSSPDRRDASDMYGRLRVTSLRLEDLGLTHITGPHKLRRSIAAQEDPAALEVLASVLEPVSFGDRYNAQKTDALTPLDRLVDAVIPDPPSRQEMAQQVDELASHHTASAEAALAARFRSWQQAMPKLLSLVETSPRLSDAGPRVQQLGQLADLGLEVLNYLDKGAAVPAGWKQERLGMIDEAEKPSGLVRFTFLPSLRRLVELAAP